jgi:hypothetical protein
MQHVQLELLKLWFRTSETISAAAERSRDDRGEVTGQTALIVLLVIAAIAAGGIIATRITDNANNIPTP